MASRVWPATEGPEVDEAPGVDAEGTGDGGVRRRTMAAFAVAAVLLVAVPLVASRVVERPPGEEHVFVIPSGTAARLAAGEDVDVLPAQLDLRLADTLVLVNQDDQAHQLGPIRVGPGERVERRFGDAVAISGFCSLHAGDRIDISVRPAT